jgi:hypothetical protein
MAKTISQREARRLKLRVQELERAFWMQRKTWSADYVGGVHLASVIVPTVEATMVRTARKCKHAVVVTVEDNNTLRLFALPHYREDVTCPR